MYWLSDTIMEYFGWEIELLQVGWNAFSQQQRTLFAIVVVVIGKKNGIKKKDYRKERETKG